MNDDFRNALLNVRDGLFDLIWPRRCAVDGCNRTSDRPSGHLCSSCYAALPWYEAGGGCSICGALVAAETRHKFVCGACAKKPPAFERAVSALRYLDAVPQLVLDFKFHAQTFLADDFAELLEAAVRSKLPFAAIDVVVPVPLHFLRRRERGYNQSAMLAERLAERLNRRFDEDALIRRFDTEHQARISGTERRKNLLHAFAIAPGQEGWIRGRTVLLVDDVATTCSTLDECAKVLVAAGARRVWCATVARAL